LTIENLPMLAPSPLVNVIELEFDKEPETTLPRKERREAEIVKLKPGGTNICSVSNAGVEGRGVKGARLVVKSSDLKNPPYVVQNWNNENQKLYWIVDAPSDGVYEVKAQVSCLAPFEGSTYFISSGKEKALGKISATSAWEDFKWQKLGALKLAKGKNKIRMQVADMPYGYIFAWLGAISLASKK
jgi:hypothetical protein